MFGRVCTMYYVQCHNKSKGGDGILIFNLFMRNYHHFTFYQKQTQSRGSYSIFGTSSFENGKLQITEGAADRDLARLSVKSFMRFKSVGKLFYSLIKSGNHFKHKHDEINRSRSDYVIFQLDYGGLGQAMSIWFSFKKSNCDETGFVVTPRSRTRDVKCIDGILCVVANRTDRNMDILIWNPFTRKIKALLPISPPHNFPSNELEEVIGFGFYNNMTKKVVIVCGFEGGCEYNIVVCSHVGNLYMELETNQSISSLP